MKKRKNLITLLLFAFSLILFLPVNNTPVRAANESISLQIDNDVNRKANYKVYKIFDAEMKVNTSNESYIYTTQNSEVQPVLNEFKKSGNHNSQWVSEKSMKLIMPLLEKGLFEEVGSYSDVSSPNISDTIKISLTDNNISFNHGGYYMILSETEKYGHDLEPTFITAVGKNKGGESVYNVKLKPMNPQIKKEIINNTTPLDLGNKVDFKITGSVPNASTYIHGYTYEIRDEIWNGLTLVEPFEPKVQIGNIVLTKGQDYTYIPPQEITPLSSSPNPQEFIISMDLNALIDMGKAHIGDTITVTYSATINSNSLSLDNRDEYIAAFNKVDLYTSVFPFTHDHPMDFETQLVDTDYVNMYLFSIMFNGFDGPSKFPDFDYNNDPMQFRLRNENGEYYQLSDCPILDRATTNLIENGKVNWVSDKNDATIFKNIEIFGVGIGIPSKATKYTIEEVSTPSVLENFGDIDIWVRPVYKENTDNKVITAIEYSKNEDFSDAQSFNIPNNKTYGVVPVILKTTVSSFLPETGGIGTTIFFVGGALLMGTAVLLRRRKIDEN